MKVAITKDNLIRNIAKQTGKSVYDIGIFYNALEAIIFNTLCSVDEERDVRIKLFEGISLNGEYVPEKTKKNNLTGKVSFVSSKIKPKFNITRTYCEKLNNK